jgi:RNA polymerase sigma-70 factor (ECF subfamily)
VLDDDVDLARDRVLVTRAQEGDRTAFDDLYLRYYRRLYRFCLRRLHDGHEAEDIAQEAFARAWRALPTFGGDRRFYPWLSVIASHLCTDVLRRRNRSTPVAEFHQGNVATTDDGGEEAVIAAVDCALVAKAFQRLSERHQRILTLREGSGWSYQRIADHEGVGITAIETLLWRARQALKREFASLAGADSRMAAGIAGLFSLSMLRRLLHAPVQTARRFAHVGPGTGLAIGSAAAATAVVLATALNTAPHVAPPSAPAPAAHANASSGPSDMARLGGIRSGEAHALSATGNGATTAVSGASLPALPSLPSLPAGGTGSAVTGLGAAVSNLGSAVTGLTTTIGDVVNGLGGSLQGPLSAAGNLSSAAPLGAGPNVLAPILGGPARAGTASAASAASPGAGAAATPGNLLTSGLLNNLVGP